MKAKGVRNERISSIALVVAMALFLGLTTAFAQSDDALEKFYSECVDKRIAQCEQKAKLASSRGENSSAAGEKALDQLSFYQNRKEDLVREMVRQNLGAKDYKVNHFLTKAYRHSNSLLTGDER